MDSGTYAWIVISIFFILFIGVRILLLNYYLYLLNNQINKLIDSVVIVRYRAIW